MKQTRRSNRQPRAERFYARCLRTYLRAHREAYGQLMLQAFRDRYRDALSTHGRIGLRFWLGVVGDEAKSLARERGAALRERAVRLKQRRLAIASGLVRLVVRRKADNAWRHSCPMAFHLATFGVSVSALTGIC